MNVTPPPLPDRACCLRPVTGVDPYKRKLPMPRAPLTAKNGQCNIGMPRDTYQRFLWVIKHFASAGFKVNIPPPPRFPQTRGRSWRD